MLILFLNCQIDVEAPAYVRTARYAPDCTGILISSHAVPIACFGRLRNRFREKHNQNKMDIQYRRKQCVMLLMTQLILRFFNKVYPLTSMLLLVKCPATIGWLEK